MKYRFYRLIDIITDKVRIPPLELVGVGLVREDTNHGNGESFGYAGSWGHEPWGWNILKMRRRNCRLVPEVWLSIEGRARNKSVSLLHTSAQRLGYKFIYNR